MAAVVFLRLGFWQIQRLHERQAWNAAITHARLSNPRPLIELPSDTTLSHYRAATVTGQFDYEHELIHSNRTRRGSPGVEFLTPVRIAGKDTAVLVNRGWVYSPDGATTDQRRWREGDTAHLAGYVELVRTDTGVSQSTQPHVVRRISAAEIAARIPYPVSPLYLVAIGDTADLKHPARRDLPVLDDGPHRGYAFQWFSFALIAIGGAGIVVQRERAKRSP